jgi:hypothetical protein
LKDCLNNNLAVGDFVLYPAGQSLSAGIISKMNPSSHRPDQGVITLRRVGYTAKMTKWPVGNGYYYTVATKQCWSGSLVKISGDQLMAHYFAVGQPDRYATILEEYKKIISQKHDR